MILSGGSDGLIAVSSPTTGVTARVIGDHKGAPITNIDVTNKQVNVSNKGFNFIHRSKTFSSPFFYCKCSDKCSLCFCFFTYDFFENCYLVFVLITHERKISTVNK